MLTPIPFCGQSYRDKTLNANAQRAVNLYPYVSPTAQDPKRVIMCPTPGYDLFEQLAVLLPILIAIRGLSFTFQGSQIRGFLPINSNLYVVCGNIFASSDPSGTITIYGQLNTSSGRCSIVTNTVDITISDGTYGYVYNLTTGAFTQIATTGGFPVNGVTNLTFQDGYYLGLVNNSRTTIQSAQLDGTTWNALAFDTTTSFPDNAVAVFSDQIILYVFGPTITEPQSDVGSIPYAFQKVASVLIQAGCAAKWSICKVGSTIMFLANDIAGSPYVAEMIGYNAQPVSSPPVNEAIAQYLRNGETISDAFAYTYREGDTQFYSITFPSVNSGRGATWVGDVKQRWWHERAILKDGRDLPDFYASWNNTHTVGNADGNIFTMSQAVSYYFDKTSQTNIPLKRIRTCQHVEQSANTLFINELFIDIEPGVGLQDDSLVSNPSGNSNVSALNPLATLEMSKDSGHTWITVGSLPMGAQGKYLTRLSFRRLGRVRKTATYRLTISDAVRCYILAAFANIKPGLK